MISVCNPLARRQQSTAPGLRQAEHPLRQRLQHPCHLQQSQWRQPRSSIRSMPSGQAEPGSARDREKRWEDAEQRSVAAAARYRENLDVLERVDAVIESVPPSSATYTLRLLTHADDLPQVALENKEAINDEFFSTVKAVLQSQAFKDATNAHSAGNTIEMAASVLAVFDAAWRAALEVRAPGGQL